MASVRFLRAFVSERLTAAAQEIFGAFEKTIVEYEEELGRQRRLLDLVWKPEVRLHRIEELCTQPDCKKVLTEQLLRNQERNSSVERAEPNPSQIKAEEEELLPSRDEEQPFQNWETDALRQSSVYEEGDHSGPEPRPPPSSDAAESRAQTDSRPVDPQPARHAEPKPTRHQNRSDGASVSDGMDGEAMTELPWQREEQVLTDQQHGNHESFSLDQMDLDPTQIKTEEEEICTGQEGEQLVLKQDADDVPLNSTYLGNVHQLLSHSFPVAESQNQDGNNDVDSGSTENTKPQPQRTNYPNTNHSSSVEKSQLPQTRSDALTGKKSLKCDLCGKTFRNKSTFEVHIKVHEGFKPYSCKICGHSTSRSSALIVHMRTHTGEKPFSCVQCGKDFRLSHSLKDHIRTHTGETPYSCNTCGKTFKKASSKSKHMKIHTEERPFSGEISQKTFISSSELKSHTKTNKRERQYTCKICGKTLTKSNSLLAHMRIHTGERPYTCKICGKTFVTSSTLSVHLRTHTGERPYACNTCGKHFRQSTTLKMHNRIHTGEKPYACNTCGKHFSHSTTLKRHIMIHTGEKPHACKTCGKTFTQSSSLLAHMRYHTGERPYSCQICGKAFLSSSELKDHSWTHTGEKPYTCNTCGKGFFRKTDLQRHINRYGSKSCLTAKNPGEFSYAVVHSLS